MEKRISFVIGGIFTLILFTACQKRPSPATSAPCDLGGGKTVKTNYSSPRMKGRKIYGDLVPFGQVWRAGANEATTFFTSSDLLVGGKTVPSGSYTIFTIWIQFRHTTQAPSGSGQPALGFRNATPGSVIRRAVSCGAKER